MIPEPPDDIEIGYSRFRLLPLIVMALAMTLLCASIAFRWFPYQDISGYHLAVGYAGIALFGLATAKFVWAMFAAKGPIVFVSRYGIRDLRVANEFILWDSILNVSACECRKRKFVVLALSPALEQRLFATRSGRAMLAANRALGVDGIGISASGLATEFDALLRSCTAYHDAALYPGRSSRKDEGVGAPRLVAGFA
ncbi:MAG: STM3941 family protein [Bradyrhizobium sp.]